ncbi:MAG: ABC transporter ATP-binding protein [Spirochaetia bacterium]
MSSPALLVQDLKKHFGAVKANDGVTLSVRPRTIHALVGENGAGKTTLVRCLFGLCRPDSGEIRLWGQPVRFSSPLGALRHGLGMVHQHFMLVDALRVWENVVLGAERGKGPGLSAAENRGAVKEVSARYGLDVDADAVVGNLPVGIQQRVEILKVLFRGARLIILDEPTAVLTPQETDRLFEVLRALREDGCTIVFITHKLAEVIAVADEVTVMRDGRSVGTWPIAQVSERMLAHEMVGRDVSLQREKEAAHPGAPVLDLENLSVESVLGDQALHGVSLTLHEGEIVGIVGVAGNGQDALVEGILGLRRVTGGAITLRGAEINDEPTRRMRARGVGCIPSDRLKMGLVAELSVLENTLLGFDGLPKLRVGPLFRQSMLRDRAAGVVREFDVRTGSLDGAVSHLSGGNQQKLILGRELRENPGLIIAVQPTRGVDIGAIEFIEETLLQRRREGAAILLVSNELEEILALADSILVLFRGAVAGAGQADRFTRDEIGLLMAGVAEASR